MLSACDTFRGKLSADGVIGITRAFVNAGVPTLLSSLWKVSDSATFDLMMHFYKQLLGEAAGDASLALQGAMVAMIREERYVRDWAAFVCYGMGR